MVEKRRGWTREEIAFVKANYGVLSLHQISSKLGRSYASISHKIHRLGLDDPRAWTAEEDQILIENYEHNPEVGKLLPNRSYDSIKVRASKLKLRKKCGKHPVDWKFFDNINDPVKAYVLGFFTGDGCIEPHIRRLTFSQRTEDVDVLYKIRSAMKCFTPLYFKRARNEVTLHIRSEYLVARLQELGYTADKTCTARIPDELDRKYYPDFIKGLMDSDGTIWAEGARRRLRFLGTKEILKQVRAYLISKGVAGRSDVARVGKEKVWHLTYGARADVKTVLELLYSTSKIHLDRKYNLAIQVLNYLNDGAFTRGVSPRKINPAQIREPQPDNAAGDPEGKTGFGRIGLQRLHAGLHGNAVDDGIVRPPQ